MEFSNAKMKSLLKTQTNKRVSDDAAEELGHILETFAGDVAEEALAITKENGRKTLKPEDIREALK